MTDLLKLGPLVAERLALPLGDVESVLLMHGVPRHAPASPARHLALLRLRVRGAKSVDGSSKPIDRTFAFGAGITVITGPNLRGKTSILELITLLLRGKARGLQADVRTWLSELSLDVEVSGNLLGFRLSLIDGQIVQGTILTGSRQELEDADDSPGACSVLDSVSDEDSWQPAVEAQVLERLGLEPLHQYANVGGRKVGALQPHGWPSYFGAIFPPVGADRVLLGEDTGTALAQRLLEVFLDLPGAALRTRLAAAAKLLKAQEEDRQSESSATGRALAARRADIAGQLERSMAILASLEARPAVSDVDSARNDVETARAKDVAALARVSELRGELAGVRQQRIHDQRHLTALVETAVAGALFHGLDPAACPRCETQIDEERRRGEDTAHTCAVCDRPVPLAEDDDTDDRRAQAEGAVAASRKAEQLLITALATAEVRAAAADAALTSAKRKLEEARAGQDAKDRAAAEREVAVAEGMLAALDSVVSPQEPPSTTLTVLETSSDILTADLAEAAQDILEDISVDITDLARRFGIVNLDSVALKRNLHMRVAKGGAAGKNFGEQTPGERLRLRYALLIALLRVGRARGVAGHPGLLLLDSIKAEEVQDEDAEQLLTALAAVCAEEAALQIIVTTQDQALPGRLSLPLATVTPVEGETALF